MPKLDNRQRHVLMALSPAGTQHLSPVQVQKLFFLLDKNEQEGAPYFDFVPYDYGPFDKKVYHELQNLATAGFVEILELSSSRAYKLTEEGAKIGKRELKKLPQSYQQHIHNLVEWIMPLSFPQLVSAIYDAYPDMRENSVFRD